MRCEECGVREGVLTTIIINNVKTTKVICRECSLKKLAEREKRLRRQEQEFEGFLAEALFQPHLGAFLPFLSQQQPKAPEIQCTQCGRTIEEFRQTSLVGCPYCYEAFAAVMKQVLEQCQPKLTHVGKAPDGSNSKNAEYERLLQRLDLAVEEKRFEDAAQIQKMLERIKNS